MPKALRNGLPAALLLLAAPIVVRAEPPTSLPDNGPDTEIVPFVALPEEQPASTVPQSPTPETQNPKPASGDVRLQKFKHLHWSPDKNTVHIDGSAEVVYTQPDTKAMTLLTANDIDYDLQNSQISAKSGVRLNRPEGTFTGNEIQYNLVEDTGYVTDAFVDTNYFQMRGKKIELKSSRPPKEKQGKEKPAKDGQDKSPEKKTPLRQTYIVTDGFFTTCDHAPGREDYRIFAHRLTVVQGQYVSADRITFYVGPTRLVTLPFTYRRSLQKSSGVAAPRPGYSKAEGLTLNITQRPVEETHTTLDLDLRVGLRYLPIGFVLYNHDLLPHNQSTLPPLNRSSLLTNPLLGVLGRLTPPDFQNYTEGRFPEELGPRATFYAALQHRQFIFNRNRYNKSQYNLLVSRFPEVGVEFANVLGHFPAAGDDDPASQNLNNTEIALRRIPNAPFLLDAGISIGAIDENPTRVTSGRLATRIGIASQPLLLGKRLSLRVGATDWLNVYTRGTVYNLLMPEIDLNYIPTRTSLFRIGYRYETDTGRTPFLFDRRDLRHELSLRYQVGGPWAFGIATSYNLENFRTYETSIVALRNFDCMQVGVGYRFQAQQFNIIFNLLPPSANRASRRRAPLAGLDEGTTP